MTILKAMQTLGYQPNSQGVCLGIAAMSAQAVQRNDVATFLQRVNFIKNNPQEQIKTVKDSKEVNYFDFLGFLDELSLYQGWSSVNDSFKSLVPKGDDINNIRKMLPDLDKEKWDTYPKVHSIVVNNFTQDEFASFILQLKTIAGDNPFSVIITDANLDHACHIGCDKSQWLSSNSDKIFTQHRDNHEISDLTANVFSPKDYQHGKSMTAALEIILPEHIAIPIQEIEALNFDLNKIEPLSNQAFLGDLLRCYAFANHTSPMQSLLEKIHSLNLSDEQLKKYLEAKGNTDFSALDSMVQRGHIQSCQLFLEKLSHVSKEVQYYVLNSKNKVGTTLLQKALWREHKEVLQALLTAIAKLDKSLQQDLLQSQNNFGNGLLHFISDAKKPDGLKLLQEFIQTFELEVQKAIFSQKNNDGLSPLIKAVEQQNSIIIEALLSEILNSNLSQSDKINLIDQRDKKDNSALFIAANQAKPQVFKQMLTLILNMNIDESLKAQLLTAKIKEHTSVLLSAVQHSNLETVKIFVDAVLSSNLSSDIKAALLRSQVGNTTAYKFAKNLGTEFIATYLEKAISESASLSNQQKRMIFNLD